MVGLASKTFILNKNTEKSMRVKYKYMMGCKQSSLVSFTPLFFQVLKGQFIQICFEFFIMADFKPNTYVLCVLDLGI